MFIESHFIKEITIAITLGMDRIAECEFHGGVVKGEVKIHYTKDNKVRDIKNRVYFSPKFKYI